MIEIGKLSVDLNKKDKKEIARLEEELANTSNKLIKQVNELKNRLAEEDEIKTNVLEEEVEKNESDLQDVETEIAEVKSKIVIEQGERDLESLSILPIITAPVQSSSVLTGQFLFLTLQLDTLN